MNNRLFYGLSAVLVISIIALAGFVAYLLTVNNRQGAVAQDSNVTGTGNLNGGNGTTVIDPNTAPNPSQPSNEPIVTATEDSAVRLVIASTGNPGVFEVRLQNHNQQVEGVQIKLNALNGAPTRFEPNQEFNAVLQNDIVNSSLEIALGILGKSASALALNNSGDLVIGTAYTDSASASLVLDTEESLLILNGEVYNLTLFAQI